MFATEDREQWHSQPSSNEISELAEAAKRLVSDSTASITALRLLPVAEAESEYRRDPTPAEDLFRTAAGLLSDRDSLFEDLPFLTPENWGANVPAIYRLVALRGMITFPSPVDLQVGTQRIDSEAESVLNNCCNSADHCDIVKTRIFPGQAATIHLANACGATRWFGRQFRALKSERALPDRWWTLSPDAFLKCCLWEQETARAMLDKCDVEAILLHRINHEAAWLRHSFCGSLQPKPQQWTSAEICLSGWTEDAKPDRAAAEPPPAKGRKTRMKVDDADFILK